MRRPSGRSRASPRRSCSDRPCAGSLPSSTFWLERWQSPSRPRVPPSGSLARRRSSPARKHRTSNCPYRTADEYGTNSGLNPGFLTAAITAKCTTYRPVGGSQRNTSSLLPGTRRTLCAPHGERSSTKTVIARRSQSGGHSDPWQPRESCPTFRIDHVAVTAMDGRRLRPLPAGRPHIGSAADLLSGADASEGASRLRRHGPGLVSVSVG